MQIEMSIITVHGFHLLFLFNLLFIIKLNSQEEFLRGQTHTVTTHSKSASMESIHSSDDINQFIMDQFAAKRSPQPV